MSALWVIVLCGALSIVYAIWATQSVLSADAGNARMQEIAAAVREGAQAYLRRQYTTIGIVGVVIFVLLAYFLGTLVAIGFAIGAILSGAAGFIGMNVSVPRSRWQAVLSWRSRPAPSPACWWPASHCSASRSTSASSPAS
jgi:K(+)-stimulated pyrophosphate-energized sodium pump